MVPPTDLIDRYRALPPMSKQRAAAALGISRYALDQARQAAGIKSTHSFPDPAQDRALADRYLALPVGTSLATAARTLGVGETRLEGALGRTRTPRRNAVAIAPAPRPLEALATPRRGAEALPAGSPETWGVLGWGEYPGGVG